MVVRYKQSQHALLHKALYNYAQWVKFPYKKTNPLFRLIQKSKIKCYREFVAYHSR